MNCARAMSREMKRTKERKHLSFLRAKLVSIGCILIFLIGMGMSMQGDETGAVLIVIALVVGGLNKFVFKVRHTQLGIDTMENIRDRR